MNLGKCLKNFYLVDDICIMLNSKYYNTYTDIENIPEWIKNSNVYYFTISNNTLNIFVTMS